MLDTTLPIHVLTGVQAIGWRKARRGETGPQPIWPRGGAAGGGGAGGDADSPAPPGARGAPPAQGDPRRLG